ncbi:hypothetical protein PR048_018798 [Dryococelus australis]|uniref:Uncharacterized protein n=1 Tax=Dryococelus australis TaxID=614101 RepID=A0ABQ9H1P7_9NEOP|nr:hypothetical protein PR048_018798 [Dryococelus australis]
MQPVHDLCTFPVTTVTSQELEKLSQFITAGDLWNGDVRNTSILEVWKQMENLVTTQSGTGVNSATPSSGYSPHVQLTPLDVSPATSDTLLSNR